MAGNKNSGRKPIPRNLKKLRGTLRRDRDGAPIPQPDTTPPDPPSWLSADGVEVWNLLAPELHRLELLTSIDGIAFASYCQAVIDLKTAIDMLTENGGTTFVTDNGYIASHPAVGQKNRALELIKSYSAQFGLTPSARTSLKGVGIGQAAGADPAKITPKQAFEGFLAGVRRGLVIDFPKAKASATQRPAKKTKPKRT